MYEKAGKDMLGHKNDMISRIKSAEVNDEFLKEAAALQSLIQSLISSSFGAEDLDNVITLQAFRLLVADMMSLFHLINEVVLKILGKLCSLIDFY